MIYRILGVLVILAIIVIGGVLLGRDPLELTRATPPAPPPASAGYSARDATLIETGADGAPLYTVHAVTIEQPAAAEYVNLDDVTIDFRDSRGQIWNARADHGRIESDATQFELQGGVKISGHLPGSPDLAQLTTEVLSLDTRTEIARTDAPVQIDWGGRQVTAHGMVARLKDQHVRLKSDVHGSFSP